MDQLLDADELRAELARRRWTHADLARHAGLSVAYIGWICRGARASDKAASRILAALGAQGAARVLRAMAAAGGGAGRE